MTESVPVPFRREGEMLVLHDQQLFEQPWLADFIKRFEHCFRYDPMRRWWVWQD